MYRTLNDRDKRKIDRRRIYGKKDFRENDKYALPKTINKFKRGNKEITEFDY